MGGLNAGLAGLALTAASSAFGCGYCIEDQVAAVYDDGVIRNALNRHHHVAFFAVRGSLLANRETRQAFVTTLASAKGVDPGSLRVSVASASLSLSYDGKRISSDQLADTLNRKLAIRALSVSLLKVLVPRSQPVR